MNVSIIIVNYNTKSLTDQCISSIITNTIDITYEIIVVDNASIDGSQEHIKEKFPDVILIESITNLGFGKANNLGAKKASGEFLFLLNSDTELKNNAIKLFYDFFKDNNLKDIGGIGCVLENAERTKIHSSGKFPLKLKILKCILFGYLNRQYHIEQANNEKLFFDNNENYFEVDYITGADLFMRKDVFIQLNGFDKDFFLYFEETELQKRMNDFGLKQYIIKGPQITHLVSASSKISSLKLSTIQTKSMYLYFAKHSKKFNYYIFKFLYSLIRLPIIFDYRYKIEERIKYIRTLISK